MAETALGEHLATERSAAVRALLGAPLLDADAEPDAFRLVVRHADWLIDYFERTCGWPLSVDAGAGFARLAKRATVVDPTRPLRRARGQGAPFDRRRYQLLCVVCAELVRHPVTTVGLLAAAVRAEADLDTARHGERAAFVDALLTLAGWGALRVSAGEVDAYLDSEDANAMLTADTARLHRLLASATAPSALASDLGVTAAIDALATEPRYGELDPDDAVEVGDEARNRYARHRVGRRLLDDPVTHLEDLGEIERTYVASPAGRRWLRERAAEAGFELEERNEGFLAIDPDAVATDLQFPAPMGNVHQLALLLVDPLVPTAPDGTRIPGALGPEALARHVATVLERFPNWAKAHREPGGAQRLARQAVELLASLGLVRTEPDGTVAARAALARYRAGDPVVRGADAPVDPSPEEPR